MEKYFYCGTKTVFNKYEKKCCNLLGFPNENTTNYANPIIDTNKKYWLLINSDVESILTEEELASCVDFSEIPLNQPKL